MQEATSSTVGLRQRLSRLVSEFSSAIQTSDESSGALIQVRPTLSAAMQCHPVVSSVLSSDMDAREDSRR